jgi:hypothetical protein
LPLWARNHSYRHTAKTIAKISSYICCGAEKAIILDLALQLGHLLRDERSLAGCGHLADTKTLNACKQHYHKKSTDFGFTVNLRQTEVKCDYRKKAGKLDAKYH